MGKDKRKGKERSNSFDYHFGTGKVGELMKRYDIKGTKFTKPDNRGVGSSGGDVNDGSPRTREDVDRDIAKAMMNDYDTRRGMEAAAMAGNKDAKKFAKKGFKAGNVYSAWDTMKDLKKEYGGGGGMQGERNRANLTYDLVRADRDAQTAAYDETYAKTTDLNELKDKLMAEATEKAAGAGSDPIEPSERMAAVEDRLEKAAGGSNTPPSLFDKDNAQPAKADDQADAARNFLTEYEDDVKKGASLRNDIQTNIANASHTVTNIYGR